VKILHVVDVYPPRVGGIERQVAALAGALCEDGHDVTVLTLTVGADRLPGPVTVVRARAGRVSAVPAVLTAIRPDVVHAHLSVVSPLAVNTVRAAVRADIPVVATVHSMMQPWIASLYRGMDLIGGHRRWPVRWTAVSRACAQTLRPVLAEPPAILPNGVDLRFWRPDPIQRGPERPGLHVLAVNRLAPRKRPLDLLRVLHATRARLPSRVPLRATVVGDGPAHERLRRYLVRHGMTSWVRLAGRREPTDVRALLSEANVFLAPATLESFGIAALEARAMGLPVVARHGTGITDFLRSGREGLLADSVDGLADHLAHLACQPGLRAAIARHNRTVPPTRFGWGVVVPETERHYVAAAQSEAVHTLRSA
jgi:glycosyltransferase involved in cell wall biosynthesis